MGTPQYAAPEQLRASEVDLQADIYALGGTLFFLLTGRAPFVGNAAQVISSIASDPAPDISTVVNGIPKELGRVIQQSLEKDPQKRHENLVALRSALLPFSTRGASQADLGRRLAAFFLDAIMAAVVVVSISQIVGMFAVLVSGMYTRENMKIFSLINIFVQYVTLIAYFAIPEAKFGRTFGKWLMGMRVIDERNESPRFFKAIIRVALVPGLSQLCVSIPSYFIISGFQNQSSPSVINMVMQLQAFQLVSWIPSLICMSTARLSNGYRGIHDLLSGTRVVRLAGALESSRPGNVPETIPVAVEENDRSGIPQIDSLQVVGRFFDGKEASAADVFMARDVALDRNVWLVPAAEFAGVDPAQSEPRTTRIRTLAQREHAGKQWHVTEAIKGVPVLDFLNDSPPLSWSSLLPVLQEILEELKTSLEEPSAPIDCNQFWIDRAGRIKFLSHSTRFSGPSKNGNPTSADAPKSADSASEALSQRVEIVTHLLDSIIKNHIVPEHVLNFRQTLKNDPDDPERLKRISQQLDAMEDRPSVWRWDDRLGVAAATYGVEYSTLFSLTLIGSLIASFLPEFGGMSLGVATFSILSVLILLAGYLFRGGPAFRFTGVSVRNNRTKAPASAIRCAVRNWVSWLPAVALLTTLALLTDIGVKMNQQASQSLETELSPLLIGLLLSLFPLLFVIVGGFAFSIFRPSRGLADLICGTRLIRK